MSGEKKHLLLVEHGGNAKSFIFDHITDESIVLYVAATNAPKWLSEYVDRERVIITDTYETAALLRDVQTYGERNHIRFDGVGTFYEHVVVQTAELAKALELINISPEAARRSSSNKMAMRVKCREKGIPTPRFNLVQPETVEELEEVIRAFGFPSVVKPVFGSQSYGVKKFESDFPSQAAAELFSLTTHDKKEVFKNFDRRYLIEEYLAGDVVSVDGFVQDGTVTIAGMVQFVMGPEPHFTQEANFIPPHITVKDQETCVRFAKGVIQALGFDNSGFHCELRFDAKQGPRLIEIACRLPGGPLQQGYQHAYGFVLARNLVDIWLGKPTTLEARQKRFVAQKAVFPRSSGKISRIDGIETARSIPGVWDFVPISAVGEEVVTYPDVPKPFYYFAAEADSAAELDEVIRNVENHVAAEVAGASIRTDNQPT